MNQLCLHIGAIKHAITIGCAFAKTNIDCQNQIGFTNQVFDIAKYANTGITNIGRMVIIADIVKTECRDKRQMICTSKRFQLACSLN